MQQNIFKLFLTQRLSIIIAGLILVAAGCRDNPQDRAAREVHEQIRAALAKSDPAAGQQQIQSAVRTHRPRAAAQNAADLVAANLILDQGLSLHAEMTRSIRPIRHVMDAITSEAARSETLVLEKERTAKLLDLKDTEIDEFQTLLAGTDTEPGLEARLREAQAQKEQLEADRRKLAQQMSETQAVIDETQARSEDLLRQADLAEGREKYNLQQQAYDLMLQRKDDYMRLQELENQISLIDDQISLATLRVEQLEDHIQHVNAELEMLKNAESRQLLIEQIEHIETTLSQHRDQIDEHSRTLAEKLDAYRRTADEAVNVFQQAAETYAQARSGAAATAAIRQADSLSYAALAASDQMKVRHTIAVLLSDILETAEDAVVSNLADRLPHRTDVDHDLLESIVDLFDRADQAYEAAMAAARRLVARGEETASNVLKSRILSLYYKMRLADALAQYDLASQTHIQIETLKEEGQEFGERFTRSEIVRLVEQGLDYEPMLAVNVELYFENIRQQLTQWKQLPEPEQRAEAVEQNLDRIETLIQTYGEEMEQLVEPLRREMLEAKERDFEDPAAAPAAPDPTADPNDF